MLPRRRSSWVSVTIFVGMRLRIATRSARMSWWTARLSPITKMFSLSRMPMAGSVSGIFTGMAGTSLGVV